MQPPSVWNRILPTEQGPCPGPPPWLPRARSGPRRFQCSHSAPVSPSRHWVVGARHPILARAEFWRPRELSLVLWSRAALCTRPRANAVVNRRESSGPPGVGDRHGEHPHPALFSGSCRRALTSARRGHRLWAGNLRPDCPSLEKCRDDAPCPSQRFTQPTRLNARRSSRYVVIRRVHGSLPVAKPKSMATGDSVSTPRGGRWTPKNASAWLRRLRLNPTPVHRSFCSASR